MGRASDVPAHVRALVYDRDERRCAAPRCSSPRGLTIQHRIGRGMGSALVDPHRPSNLLTLCPRCHLWVETYPAVSDAHGWSVPRGVDPAEHPVWTWRGWLLLHDEGTTYELPDHPGVDDCACGCSTSSPGDLWAPIESDGRPRAWNR